jgi:23S rRNA (cytidine1920-2'-O)/16S rRNA (cytidine1409-2'-O)-methyltransferase
VAASKSRLDQMLVERGLASTRARAQALVMSGRVRVPGVERPKSGMTLPADAAIEVIEAMPWVGRGGEKLAGALEDLGIVGSPGAGAVVSAPGVIRGTWLDCGASTGGFTQVLLAYGAEKVYAMDVGYGQLAAELRADPRVIVVDRFNIRNISRDVVPDPLDGVTLDLSFISSRLVLPLLPPFLKPGAAVILMFKPQFEAERSEIGKGGVIRDPGVRAAVIARFESWAAAHGWTITARANSRVAGQTGNIEVFFRLIPVSRVIE